MTAKSTFKKEVKSLVRTYVAVNQLSKETTETLIDGLMAIADNYVKDRAQPHYDEGVQKGHEIGQKQAVQMFAAVLKSNGRELLVQRRDIEAVSLKEYEVKATINADKSMTYQLVGPEE